MRQLREADIQKAVLDLLAAKHVFAFRLNTASFTGEHKGKKRFFKSHSLGPGAADILAFPRYAKLPGQGTWIDTQLVTPLWIECKRPNGKLTDDQKAFWHAAIVRGYFYLVADSVDTVAAWLKERGL